MTKLSHDSTNTIRSAFYLLGDDATAEEIAAQLHWSVSSVRRYLSTLRGGAR